MTQADPLNIAVAVASLGRPQNLRALLESLSKQTQLPRQVVLSVERPEDCPDLSGLNFEVEAVYGPRGLCQQRNRALDRLVPDVDVVVFYDDDFVPSRRSLQGVATAFAQFADTHAMTGLVLEDGILGPGIPPTEAKRIVEAWDAQEHAAQPKIMEERLGCYGCNMAFRVAAIADQRFDEQLTHYGWLEDLDFAARMPGTCIQTDAFVGVHCGEKVGREKNGRPLGHAQMVNPIYLWRKGSIPLYFAVDQMARNFLKNHARAFFPEPWVDRKGRTIGNWIGLRDALFSRELRQIYDT